MARRAMTELHDTTFHGRQIIVEFAGEKTKRREALGPSSEDKCYNCNRPGHWASECRRPAPRGPREPREHSQRSPESYDRRDRDFDRRDRDRDFDRRDRDREFDRRDRDFERAPREYERDNERRDRGYERDNERRDRGYERRD